VSVESDRQSIVDLTIEYCWAIDERRFADLANVFEPEATADFGDGPHDGVAAIIERIDSALSPLDRSQHMISNHQVKLAGDSATCRCYLQAQHVRRGTEGGRNFIIAGHYEDDLRRGKNGWRIVDRRLVVTWTEGNRAVVSGGESR
jgi:hypothetical protein